MPAPRTLSRSTSTRADTTSSHSQAMMPSGCLTSFGMMTKTSRGVSAGACTGRKSCRRSRRSEPLSTRRYSLPPTRWISVSGTFSMREISDRFSANRSPSGALRNSRSVWLSVRSR